MHICIDAFVLPTILSIPSIPSNLIYWKIKFLNQITIIGLFLFIKYYRFYIQSIGCNIFIWSFQSYFIFIFIFIWYLIFLLISESKNIVVHGSNLGLTISKLRLSLSVRKMFNIPED